MRQNSEWERIMECCPDDDLKKSMLGMEVRSRKVRAHQLMQSAVYLMWSEGNLSQAEKMINDILWWLDKNATYFRNKSDHQEAYYFLLDILLIRKQI